MIQQKNRQKLTALGKRRVNLQRLESRVWAAERAIAALQRIEQNKEARRTLEVISLEEIQTRLQAVERIVLPDEKTTFTSHLRKFVTFLCVAKDKTRKGFERCECNGTQCERSE